MKYILNKFLGDCEIFLNKNFEQPFTYSPYIFYAGSLNMDAFCKYAKCFRKYFFLESY